MFGVQIEGRLGNQMFQYAFALAQQERLKDEFYIDGYRYFFFNRYFILPSYFTLGTSISFKNLFNKSVFYLGHSMKPPIVVQDQWFDANTFLKQHSRPGIIYKGFFQSEQYFYNVRDKIKKEFNIKKKHRVNLSDFTGNSKETIVVHIRRTDYLEFGSDDLQYNLSLPDNYYHRCLSELNTDDKNILFLSDDMEYVKKNFDFPGAIYSENNTEITDFQLLMQADYLVLSNSTFSWWGAYLNTKVRQVFAPEYWLGFKVKKEWPNGIVCPGWKKINVL
ncbi:MAG: alpha-1,2-fucosyltransferase [Bacteroidetes bacterium]|nr:alpha-1,2-fucosyltransferase [Bacteroidota bacterium]